MKHDYKPLKSETRKRAFKRSATRRRGRNHLSNAMVSERKACTQAEYQTTMAEASRDA